MILVMLIAVIAVGITIDLYRRDSVTPEWVKISVCCAVAVILRVIAKYGFGL